MIAVRIARFISLPLEKQVDDGQPELTPHPPNSQHSSSSAIFIPSAPKVVAVSFTRSPFSNSFAPSRDTSGAS